MALPYQLENAPGKRASAPGGRGWLLLGAAAILLMAAAVGYGLRSRWSVGASPTTRSIPPAPIAGSAPAAGEVLSAPPAAVPRAVAPSNLATAQVGLVSPVPAQPDPGLAAVLDNAAARYLGSLSVVVRNLRTGAMASLNADQPMRAASLYKLFVLESAMERIEKGEMRSDEMLTLSPAAADGDPNVEWPAGSRISTADSLKAMVDVSNNAAADILEERVGGDDRINADMKSLGLQQSIVGKDFAFTSASDMALLLEAIASGKAVDSGVSQQMLGLMTDQRRNDRLPLPLPLNVKVAHKTGELTHLRNEAGIVYSPSGPYLFVALADKAQSDAAARQVILDLSRDVYGYMEPGGLTQYLGLPPRLAADVFQTFDAKGRISALDDPWGQTTAVDSSGVKLADGVKTATLRETVIPSLAAMQWDAEKAGATFWVTSGYQPPRGIDAPFVLKDATALPIRVELAPRKPSASPPATPAPAPKVPVAPPAPPAASQQWLGTMVGVADSRDGKPSQPSFAGSATGRWLVEHAWEYGFVLAPAESPQGKALGYEPWKLRWVGRGMAERLHSLGYEKDPSAIVTAELQKAEQELGDPSRWSEIEDALLFNP